MSQPTEPTIITDLTTVTGVADIVINGTRLWVSQGKTPAGSYWTLFTASDNRLAGTVVEHDGQFEAVIRQNIEHAYTAQAAALLIVAGLHAATPKGTE